MYSSKKAGQRNGPDLHLSFGTRTGVAVLFAAGVLIFAIVAFVLEKRTHKLYVDRGPKADDEDGLF